MSALALSVACSEGDDPPAAASTTTTSTSANTGGGGTTSSGGGSGGESTSTTGGGGAGGDGGSIVPADCDGTPALASGVSGVYMEVELLTPVAGWTEETAVSGYLGSSYFQWTDTMGGAPGDGDPFLSYCFEVETAGTYLLEIHGRRDHDVGTFCENAADDACNDVWVQIDGQGSGNQTWTKKMIKHAWGTWDWDEQWDPQNGSPFTTEIDLSAGTHVLGIAGRSHRVKIDAIRIYLMGTQPPTG